jgi:hypothetical protein
MVVEAFHVVVARKHREKQESGHPLQEDSPTRQHLLNVPPAPSSTPGWGHMGLWGTLRIQTTAGNHLLCLTSY